ncbi:MAG: hypothetical protein COC10_10925 [Sphingobium sp.]|nr:MAG: hypothetical protein COC10_10925 [Sphingobium sp.]
MIRACLRILMMARMADRTRVLLGSRNGLARPCRIWTGAQSRGGKRPGSGPYGSVWVPDVGGVRAHVAAAWIAGVLAEPRVPPGMNLDHRCERTLCIEESHLELMPAEDNRALRWTRRKKAA